MDQIKDPRSVVLNETLEHSEAFEYYYSLGEARSLQAVTKFSGKSFTTLKRWSASFKWTDRVRARDAEIADRLADRATQSVLISKTRYREAISQLMEKFEGDVRDGKIRIRNIQDFEKIVKLDMELMGEGGFGEEGSGSNLQSLASVLEHSARLLSGAIIADTGGGSQNYDGE